MKVKAHQDLPKCQIMLKSMDSSLRETEVHLSKITVMAQASCSQRLSVSSVVKMERYGVKSKIFALLNDPDSLLLKELWVSGLWDLSGLLGH